MEFDIWDKSERKVVCIRNDGNVIGGNDQNLLEIGKQYTVADTEVNPWYTLVSLKEFPGKKFNSVVFKEIED